MQMQMSAVNRNSTFPSATVTTLCCSSITNPPAELYRASGKQVDKEVPVSHQRWDHGGHLDTETAVESWTCERFGRVRITALLLCKCHTYFWWSASSDTGRRSHMRVSVHSLPCCRPSSTRSAAYMASIAQRWRSSMSSSSSSFLAFVAKKKQERTEIENQRIPYCKLCLQKRPDVTRRDSTPDHSCVKSLPNVLIIISPVGLLPGLEGNDVEGTLGRETFPVPSISSRVCSNSTWTSSSSSASRSSWQKCRSGPAIKHTHNPTDVAHESQAGDTCAHR